MAMSLAEHPEVRSATELLEAWIEAQRVYRELPGLSVGIVHDQTLIWAHGFGWADVERREPATPSTLYRIGSITKLFTATAILILRDAGKLALDDPLTAHLAWFAMKSASPDAGAITIRHLLTHTAGLPREAAFPYWTDYQFPSVEEVRARLATQERPGREDRGHRLHQRRRRRNVALRGQSARLGGSGHRQRDEARAADR